MKDKDTEFEGRPDLVRQRARTFIIQRVTLGIFVTCLVSTLALLLVNAVSGYQTRVALLDCTQPTGECAQRGQQQTADAIQQLIDSNKLGDVATQRVVVLAAACSEEPSIKGEKTQATRIALLERCVNDQLKLDESRKPK